MKEEDYSNIEFIVNWDDNPATNQSAKQVVYSTHSRLLPDGDYNYLVGKVVEKIYLNRYKQIVIVLRKPKSEDLSQENLDRKPLTSSLNNDIPTAEQAETIKKPATQEDIIRMRRELVHAEMAARKIYGGNQ